MTTLKKTRPMLLVEEIIGYLKADGKEINSGNVTNFAMSQTYQGTHLAGKFDGISPGIVAKYFREFYEAE